MKGMTIPTIRTIEELMQYFYQGEGQQYIMKADDPMLTTTTGVWNPLYGAKVWDQLNREVNIFSALPKKPWERSGFRVMTARGAAISSPTGGTAENGAIADTTKPTFAIVSHKPKTIQHTFEASEITQKLGPIDDGIEPMVEGRRLMGQEHVDHMNAMLGFNVTTPASNNLESIDRVCSSYGEVTNCVDVHANDSDIFGLDRDAAATWADAYVDHNSDANRDFTTSLIDTAIRTIWTQSGKRPNVIFTGEDTLERIVQSEAGKQRYVGQAEIQVGLNGVQAGPQGAGGISAGIGVATYRGIPILTTQVAVQDVLSRVYLLNTEHVWLGVLAPTRYFETGMSKGDPWAHGKIGDEGMYLTHAELRCNFFKAQGKIRDLQ